MNSRDIAILNLCLEDSLFAALYDALCCLERKWQTPKPVDMWIKALSARRDLSKSTRPDLLVRQLFADMSRYEAVVVEALLMWMLINESRSVEKSSLNDALALMLLNHGEAWETVRAEFRESEGRNERFGYIVCPTDYSSNAIPAEMCGQGDGSLVHDLVSEALKTSNPELCHVLFLLLARVNNSQNGHAYDNELSRLAAETDKIEQAGHAPRSLVNNFQKGSCNFELGSTMNGNVSTNL